MGFVACVFFFTHSITQLISQFFCITRRTYSCTIILKKSFRKRNLSTMPTAYIKAGKTSRLCELTTLRLCKVFINFIILQEKKNECSPLILRSQRRQSWHSGNLLSEIPAILCVPWTIKHSRYRWHSTSAKSALVDNDNEKRLLPNSPNQSRALLTHTSTLL